MVRFTLPGRGSILSSMPRPQGGRVGMILLSLWVVCGLVSIIVPLTKTNSNKMKYYNYAGKYVEYENNQRQYDQQGGENQQYNENGQYNNNGDQQQNYNENGNNNNQAQGDDAGQGDDAANNQNQNNQNNNYNYNNNGNRNLQNNDEYYMQMALTMECRWYQWKCRQQKAYMLSRRDQNNGEQRSMVMPSWYYFIGGSATGDGEEQRRYYEELGIVPEENTGAIKFVNAWMFIMYLALLIYGGFALYMARQLGGLILLLFVFAQFSLLQVILLAQGIIKTDSREFEQSVYGWPGQTAVLMAYRAFAYCLFCFGFGFVLGGKALYERYRARQMAAEEEGVLVDKDAELGSIHESPSVSYKNMS